MARICVIPLAAAMAVVLAGSAGAVAQDAGPDPFLDAQQARALAWSSDGGRIAFQLAGIGTGEIRVHSVADGSTTVVVPDSGSEWRPHGAVDLRWTADGERLIYRAGTSYYTVAADSHERPELLVHGGLLGDFVQLSPDRQQVSFIRDGSLWVLPVDGGAPTRLTPGEGLLEDPTQRFSRLAQPPQWSPDSRRVTYLSRTGGGHRLGIVEVESGEVSWLVTDEDVWRFLIVDWSPSGDRLAVSRMSEDFRRKSLIVADTAGSIVQRVWEDEDSAWVSHNIDTSFDLEWSPDGESLAFLSNRDGWRHLFVAELRSGRVRRLTEGSFVVMWAGWSPDGSELAFVSNSDGAHQRSLRTVPAAGGAARVVFDAVGAATDGWSRRAFPVPAWSPDGATLAFPFSAPEDPFQVRLAWSSGGSGTQIYSARNETLREVALPRMEPVSFRSRDGTHVPGVLWLPADFDASKRYPAVVHIYGGWGQMATLGWHRGARTRLLAYLTSRGYVVLVADPRGSEGYGEAYSKALYQDAGGKQADDLIAAAEFLAETGYVEPSAIALYGHSYGGYLTLQTMLAGPDVYGAGILVAGVYDWQRYNPYGRYSQIRFGSPDDPDGTFEERARPYRRVADLRSPVIVLHGTTDFNVRIAHSEILVNELLREGKEFEYMVYPGADHGLAGRVTNRDFFLRVASFLDRHIGGPATAITRREAATPRGQ